MSTKVLQPHPHPFGDPPCWADQIPLAGRRVLAAMLARACKRSYDAAQFVVARNPQPADIEVMRALTIISAEMSDLHLDVTERAEVAAS